MSTLAQFLRSHREQILREWEHRTLQLPSSLGLPREARRDHIPQLLDSMANAIERGDTSTISLEQLPLTHAGERWLQDYDLREIVAEYRLLRRVVLDTYIAEDAGALGSGDERMSPLMAFNENIDHAITDAVDHYALQRDRMREYFIGMLSHDMRDPLHAIVMSAEMQLLQADASADIQLATRIVTSARKLKRLIDDMLDVTRGRLGSGLPVTPVETDLQPLLVETVAELADSHPARRIECIGVQDGEDLRGQWDPLRVMQAVSNLVANALKHGADPIVVSARDREDHVLLEVRNKGEVPVELRSRIFEPFETRDPTLGTGLGLYIAAEVARAHGGRLMLAPDTPGETRFLLELPRPPLAEPRA